MKELEPISEQIREEFVARNAARDEALAICRILTRHCAHAIRAIHRGEHEEAWHQVTEAGTLSKTLHDLLRPYPELMFSGYTQDALKEFAEANITCSIIEKKPLPTPESLRLDSATYLNGLAESIGELRRRCLDILRQGYSEEAERLLGCMDEIYMVLVTMDFPDAITNGLRRQTDLVRGIIERTRGDLTISLREQELQSALSRLSDQLNHRM